MEKMRRIETRENALRLLGIALRHEWAVSFEYVIHAYSMPKGKYFYKDPVMKLRTDSRAQIIQIGIDEMYHALQLGIIIEKRSLAFYLEVEKHTESSAGKSALHKIIDEERKHWEQLKQLAH